MQSAQRGTATSGAAVAALVVGTLGIVPGPVVAMLLRIATRRWVPPLPPFLLPASAVPLARLAIREVALSSGAVCGRRLAPGRCWALSASSISSCSWWSGLLPSPRLDHQRDGRAGRLSARLGSVRALTDGTGKFVQTYRTDAFGQVTGSQGGSIQPFGFTGEATDPESGLVLLRARAYSPALGRFMQRDPIGGSGVGVVSLNRYAYAQNNPVTNVDPSGLLTLFIGGIGGSTYADFVTALKGPPTNLVDVRDQICAFNSCTPAGGTGLNLAENIAPELARATLAAAQPLFDPDAHTVASQVKRDPALGRVELGFEQLNLIGYSGGATVAFDAAVILQRYGIHVNNLVTLGGFTLRGKPGNVGTWISITGDQDRITTNAATPDVEFTEGNVSHIAIGPYPSYLTGNGQVQTLFYIHLAGLK